MRRDRRKGIKCILVPRNYEDLKVRRELFEVWAKATYGLMGRTPDFLNVTVTSMASNSWF